MQDLVEKLTMLLKSKNMKLVTAESCTGGLLGATLTHRPGASEVYERGFITYSNAAKHELLGVPNDMLEKFGAVSAETAQAMAQGALKNSSADLAVSITGIAGPDGGSEAKPVGLVFFGYALKGGSAGSLEHRFEGNREKIQSTATVTALKHLISVLEQPA
ncbi:MAG: CinA family protein [Rhodospirillales bacterium]|nr:CinA family protein [Rhodospirillales bacterium]